MHQSSDVEKARTRCEGQYGCIHYRRRCKLVAPCCDEIFWCRHCHNEKKQDPKKRHELVRKDVKELICAICDLRQPVSTYCRNCQVAFGAYSCLKCNFFDDDLTRQQFHCDRCTICRVGGRQNFFHCDMCGCCYSNSLSGNHVCVANSMRNDCPVCLEYLFDSIRRAAVLPCGHTVHADCLQEMENAKQLSCPLCCKSFDNMQEAWDRLDEEARNNPMPPEYASWMVDILCNDCLQESKVPFHVVGLQCSACRSYNTRRVAIKRGESS